MLLFLLFLLSNSKEPPEVFYKKSFSRKFRKIHWKTPVLETLFDKVAILRTATLLNIDSNIDLFQ